jgi:hypothetical protein
MQGGTLAHPARSKMTWPEHMRCSEFLSIAWMLGGGFGAVIGPV